MKPVHHVFHRQLLGSKLILLVSMLFLASLVFAQQGRGTILGTVNDASGAVVPGATVVITNAATNVASTVTSNEDGNYFVPNLIVGTYSVSVTKPGFKKALRSGITLEVDQKPEINLTLETGAVSETIEVSGQGPLVDTASATVGKVIDNRRVVDLPVNGRSAFALVQLSPAVKSAFGPTASGFADRGSQVAGVSINGGPTGANAIIIDGLGSLNPLVPDVNVQPTVDGVQEFKVQSNTMSAEFGYTLGGVLNVATRSGTNAYKGSLYEFFRNDYLDANSWARNRLRQARTPLRYNQFGGSIGGPVQLPKKIFGPLGGFDGHDRTFFFVNYEGYRHISYSTGTYTMPTEAFRRGDFSNLRDASGNLIPVYDPATTRADPARPGFFIRDPFPGNIIPSNRLDPVSKNILAVYPLPNRTPSNAFTNQDNFYGAVSGKRSMNQLTTRVDHRFSEQNSFTFRYIPYKQFFDQGINNLYPDPVVRQRFDPFRGHNVVLSDTHSFTPNLLHEIRIGVARQIFDFAVASAGGDWPQKLGLPASVPNDTFPAISNGLPAFQTGTVGKRGGLVWQLFDSLTWIHGSHTTKFGTELRLTQANNLQKSSPSGSFSFAQGLTGNPDNRFTGASGSSFATFMLGAVSSASVTTHLGESEVGKGYGFYVQEDWKLMPRLTFNLGLRYDYQEQPHERRNGSSRFTLANNPLTNLPGRTEYLGTDFPSVFKNDPNDFAPRFGFAWDVFGKQKTVLRGGYSVFYGSLFSYFLSTFADSNGFSTTSTSYNSSNSNFAAFQFSSGFPTLPTQPQGAKLGPNLAFSSQNFAISEEDAKTPMSQQWNLSLQQQIAGGILIDATYSGNHGTHLVAGGWDVNQIDPANYALGDALNQQVTNPCAGKVPGTQGAATVARSQTLRPYPCLGSMGVRNPRLGNSIYHALLLTGEKRFSKGLVLLASYTWGKLLSDSEQSGTNSIGGEQIGITGYQNGRFNRRAERSVDPSDISHRFVLSGIYELPFGKGKRFDLKNGFANLVVGGWQINTITTFSAGLPLVVRGANNRLADRPNLLRKPDLPSNFVNPTPGFNPANDLGILWFDPSAFANPADWTFGNTPRTLPNFRTPGAINSDLSLFKTFQLAESLKLQFRAEAFNAFNHVNLSAPNATFGNDRRLVNGVQYAGNTSVSFGYITGSRDPRNVQFALKLMF